jgi:CTP synthase
MEDQQYIALMGGTMRLGAYPCALKADSIARDAYGSELISERHRHRYEFNNEYRTCVEENGMRIAGTSPDDMLVEAVEIPEHPFYIAVQYHPEFKSRPDSPHPIFREFVKTAYQHKKK